MKRYLVYLVEDGQKKELSLDYLEVDYFHQTSDRLTIRLYKSSKQSAEFDQLVEDLTEFSQKTDQMELKVFSRDGHHRVITITYYCKEEEKTIEQHKINPQYWWRRNCQLHPGTYIPCCGCFLPDLTGFTG